MRVKMPNPFPGMNPFLERPTLWDSFHNAFVVEINRALVTNLPSGFATRADARCYVNQGEERIRIIKPDDILIGGQSASADGSTHFEQSSLPDPQPKPATPPTGIAIRQPVEVRELFLEIIDMDNEEQVVTIIEVLSPSNKASGVKGRADYRRKQNAVLNSDTNLLEIDLLRGGLHTIAAPREDMQVAGRWDYAVSLHRVDKPHQYPFWLCGLRDALPVVPVPLRGRNSDLLLDLQIVLNDCYDANGFDRNIRYNRAPVPPLSPDDEAWSDALLREKGLREIAPNL